MHYFRSIKTLCISAAICCLISMPITGAFAQGGPGGPDSDPGCDPCCPVCLGCPPQCIPIDGGLILLLAAGVGVGVWRGRKNSGKVVGQ